MDQTPELRLRVDAHPGNRKRLMPIPWRMKMQVGTAHGHYMWKLIFHIETIFNMEIGFYEPKNYQLEAEVSADEMFEAIKHGSFYLRGTGDIELKDDGYAGGDHIRVFENCCLTEE